MDATVDATHGHGHKQRAKHSHGPRAEPKAIERGKGEEQDATQFAQRESMMKYSCHSSTAKVRKKWGATPISIQEK